MEIIKVENSINDLRNEVFNLENFIQDKNKSQLIEKLMLIKKKVIKIDINLNKLELNNIDTSKQRKQFVKISHILEHYDDYSDDLARAKHYRNTYLLTLITIISFPLTIIVGYFGMNFVGMGSSKKGIFGVKNPHIFVFTLAVVAIFSSLISYGIYHNRKIG